MKRIYYYLELTQKAPLRLSNGDGEETDSDLRLDARGLPYIPGTALAGVLRSYMTEEDAKRIFGDVDIQESIKTKENAASSSKLIVSDAVMAPDAEFKDVSIMNRDGVGLDDWGQTIKGAKYDFQVVETTRPYYAVLEWFGDETSEKTEIQGLIEPLLQRLSKKDISFGARTSRGYGEMLMQIQKKEFEYPRDLKEWLDYYPLKERFRKEQAGNPLEGKNEGNNYTEIKVHIVMEGSFNIRVNTARAECLPDGSIPDSVPLMNAQGKPVIPGTAWAGAFRHHIHRILRESGMTGSSYEEQIKRIDYECFGMSHKKELAHKKSPISFFETAIEGGMANTITRNAVDRYTAAPKNTGLFTNQVWTGGEGCLRICIDNKVSESDVELLLTAIYDMGLGLLTIGGEAGIGRGIIKVTELEINGITRNEILDTGLMRLQS